MDENAFQGWLALANSLRYERDRPCMYLWTSTVLQNATTKYSNGLLHQLLVHMGLNYWANQRAFPFWYIYIYSIYIRTVPNQPYIFPVAWAWVIGWSTVVEGCPVCPSRNILAEYTIPVYTTSLSVWCHVKDMTKFNPYIRWVASRWWGYSIYSKHITLTGIAIRRHTGQPAFISTPFQSK